MEKKLKILHTAGARPNFMKIAPLVHAFARRADVEQKIVHTGQHYDPALSQIFFEQLGIPSPDINLNVGSLPREQQIDKIMEAFDPVMNQEQPAGIIVVGDVNSTVACARVAKRYGAGVAHVEAGLRSFDLQMPEEHNRRETDLLSDLLFVTEESGMKNLKQEGAGGKAFLTGNVMIDTLKANLPLIRKSTIVESLALTSGNYIAATFHRPSNVDGREELQRLLYIIEHLAAQIKVVLPLHPRTKNSAAKHGLEERLRAVRNLVLIEPVGYHDFMKLVLDSAGVVTDSGGIQEETTWLNIPCITMRENTERPATVEMGTNVLAGTKPEAVLAAADRMLRGEGKKGQCPPLWDGEAAERIAAIIVEEWN